MSEFTDFHAVLTEAESLQSLRGMLVEHVGGAEVPLNELPYADVETFDDLEALWRAVPKPAWLVMGIKGTLDDLAKIGPALHIKVEEDFSSWSLDARCNGASFTYAFIAPGREWREATDGIALYDAHDPEATAATTAIAPCLGLTVAQLQATFEPEGGQSFAQAVGVEYEQMLDMELEDIEPGEVTYAIFY